MTIPPHREALVSRLEQELTAFALVRDISAQDAAGACVLHNWTIIHKPNVHIEICGVTSAMSGEKPSLLVTGRVVHIDIAEKVVVTTTGLYRLGRRPSSDSCSEKRASVDAELSRVKEILAEYREDLMTVRRYLSEMMSVDCETETANDTRPLRRALH
ncbi:hypothetical protein [Donghicola sp. XS_ASV15]|uniref:hypothetical protein n=1 Tax=Donghicola sp. XS_ASV15 TaxID=3241295 RepID=UPI0035172CEC